MLPRHPTFLHIVCGMLALPLASAMAQDMDCPVEKQVKLTIQTSPFPSLPGQSVNIGVFIEPLVSITDPTGSIQILDGLTDLGTSTIKLGQISTTTTFTSAGAHVLQAIYSGDVNYCAAFASMGQQVDRITSSITLTTSASAAAAGAPVTFTVQLTPATPTGVADPTGPVQFVEGTTVFGVATPVAGKASLTLSTLGAGTHQIVAVLIGDTNWYSVRSTPVTLTVNRGATTTLLNGTATATQVTLTATVTSPGSVTPDGAVQFVDTTSGVVLGSAALPAASLSLPVSKIAGEPIVAVYSGSTSFASSTSTPLGIPGILNAAGAPQANFAPDEIVSLFGFNLSSSAKPLTAALPLPFNLGGTSVTVADSAGVTRQAGLYLAAAQQINFVIPTATAPGAATVTVTGAPAIPIHVNIAGVAPGIFTSAVQVVRVQPDGSQTLDTLTSTTPIAIGNDPVYLVLYGTGIRNRLSLAGVTCAIGNANLPVAYAGAQAQFPGLDQVDVLLPASLQGAGRVNVTLTADGQVSNAMTLTFQ